MLTYNRTAATFANNSSNNNNNRHNGIFLVYHKLTTLEAVTSAVLF